MPIRSGRTRRHRLVELAAAEEALQIVAMVSTTFWRPVTPNTIFVAADTPAKRKEVDAGNVTSPSCSSSTFKRTPLPG